MPKTRKLQLIVACLTFGVICQLSFLFMLRLIDQEHYARERLEVTNELSEFRLQLEQLLNSTFYVSRGLEMLVAGLTSHSHEHVNDHGGQLSDHWGEVELWAAEALADLPHVMNIGMSEGYVIQFAYPMQGNSKTLGVDYRNLPGQWPAVEQAIANRQPVVAGPLKLIQGGMGIICRVPVFTDKRHSDGGTFLGIVSMVVDYDDLMRRAGFVEASETLAIAIKGKNGLGEKGELFFGEQAVFDQGGVQQVIDFLGGTWVIAAKPIAGWSKESPYSYYLNILGYLIFIITSVLMYLAVSGVQQRLGQARRFTKELEQRVDERTRQLNLAKEQAESANQAKSEFLAVVTHELRTPLNSIIGLTDLIRSMELGRDQRKYLNKVSTSANLLLELINNILSYSKMESGKESVNLSAFSLQEMVSKVADLFQVAAAKKGVEFSVAVAADVPRYVLSDEAKIMQILINLCGNAMKFTEKGAVSINVERVTGQDESNHQAKVRFVVTDTGIGISDEHRPVLFQAFSQVDSSRARKYAGTGLGLSICKRFVDLMGGVIDVESSIHQGSCFWFELNLETLEQLPVPSDEFIEPEFILAQSKAKLSGLTLILAEDNEFNQTLAKALLVKVGVQVQVAENGLEVLAQLKQGAVDGILMDVQMPQMDGLEATRQIRTDPRFEDIPIIAMTANAMEEDRQRVIAAGMNAFIAKPINPERLYKVLQEQLCPVRDEESTS